MTQPEKSSIDLGSNVNGITLTRSTDPEPDLKGSIEINVWDGDWDEAASVRLFGDDVAALKTWLQEDPHDATE